MKSTLIESTKSKFQVLAQKPANVLKRIQGVLSDFGSNRNGRIYPRELWENVINSDYVKEMIDSHGLVGELDHPEERLEISLQNVSHVINDMWIEGDKVMGVIDILPTPNGKIVNELLDYGTDIGISSRGAGSVGAGNIVDPDYQFITFDFVARPSCEAARLNTILEGVKVDLENNSDDKVNKILESYKSELKESSDGADITDEEKEFYGYGNRYRTLEQMIKLFKQYSYEFETKAHREKNEFYRGLAEGYSRASFELEHNLDPEKHKLNEAMSDQEVYKVVLNWYKDQIEAGKMTLNQCYELLSDKAKVSLNKLVDKSKIQESIRATLKKPLREAVETVYYTLAIPTEKGERNLLVKAPKKYNIDSKEDYLKLVDDLYKKGLINLDEKEDFEFGNFKCIERDDSAEFFISHGIKLLDLTSKGNKLKEDYEDYANKGEYSDKVFVAKANDNERKNLKKELAKRFKVGTRVYVYGEGPGSVKLYDEKNGEFGSVKVLLDRGELIPVSLGVDRIDLIKDVESFVCYNCGKYFVGKLKQNGTMPNCPNCYETVYKDDDRRDSDGHANKDVHIHKLGESYKMIGKPIYEAYNPKEDQKYKKMIQDEFGYCIDEIDVEGPGEIWIYLKDKYISSEMEGHTIHEQTFKACYEMLKNGIEESLSESADGVPSSLELNTGVLPIIDTGIYGREEDIWRYIEDDEGSYEDGPETMEDLDKAMIDIGGPMLQEMIQEVLPSATVEVTGVHHPTFYNYSTDELEFNLGYDPNELNELINRAVSEKEFEEYLKSFSSYSGFVSFMADNLEDFDTEDYWKKAVQVLCYYLGDKKDYHEALNYEATTDFWDDVIQSFR